MRSPRGLPAASRRTHFFLKIFIIPFELQVQIVTKIGPVYFPLTENKTASNGSTFCKKLTSKRVTFLSKSDNYRPPHSTVFRLVDVIRSDSSTSRIVTPNHMMDSHSTSSPFQIRKYIWKWINFSVVIIVIITNTIIKKMI